MGGMAALQSAAPAFCQWSALQALLAVVANNFGTFAGTLVIQRRVSQRSAGIFNAIGLLIPVLNIAAFLLRHQPETAAAGGFVHLMTLPAWQRRRRPLSCDYESSKERKRKRKREGHVHGLWLW